MAVARQGLLATTFSALQSRPYRWYWLYRLAGEGVMNLTSVAQGWLVYQLTGSALALGWVGAGRAVATVLVAPWGGVLCDRFERRSVLLWARGSGAAVTLCVGVLVALGAIEVWHLALATLLNGVFMALITGAQQAIVSDLVDEQTVMNAVSLNAVGIGVTGMVFPAVGGLVIRELGPQAVYWACTLVYLFLLWTLTRVPTGTAAPVHHEPPLRALAEGLRYTARSPVLAAMFVVAMARFLFSMSYTTFMPKFADEVLGFDAAGLGLLLAAPGLGGLLASLSVASLRDYRHKGRLLLSAGLTMGGLLVAFGLARAIPLVFVLLVLLGGCGGVVRILNQTIMQTHAEERLRGRVMGLYAIATGTGPFTSIPMGALADAYGVPLVLAVQGTLLALVFGAVAATRKEVREAA